MRPCPSFSTAWADLKLAVTFLSEFIVSVQVVAVPLQSPSQPTHGDPAAGVAVSVTTVPAAYEAAEGLAVTVPLPVVLMLIL